MDRINEVREALVQHVERKERERVVREAAATRTSDGEGGKVKQGGVVGENSGGGKAGRGELEARSDVDEHRHGQAKAREAASAGLEADAT